MQRGLAQSALVGENIDSIESPIPMNGQVEITSDRVGFVSEDGQTSIKVNPGDEVGFRAVVSTSGNILTRLVIAPSVGEGPIWDQQVTTEWVQGEGIPLSLSYTVPEGMKFVKIGLDQPNWTESQRPEGVTNRTFPSAQMTGTIRWRNARVVRNPGMFANVPISRNAMILGGLAGGGVLFWWLS